MKEPSKANSPQLESLQEDTNVHLSTSAENAPVEFDPSLPWETNFDGSSLWIEGMHYIGRDHDGKHVVRNKRSDGKTNVICSVEYVRNIQPFTASMLEVGEYMETEIGPDGKRNLLTKIGHNKFIDLNNLWSGEICLLACDQGQIKGRRVDVDLIVREV